MNLFQYNGYYGDAHCDTREQILHGKIQFINDLVTYEAETIESLETEFRVAVEDYLETCNQLNKQPDKPFKGSFNVRISPELHRKSAVRALMAEVSLNEWVQLAIRDRLHSNFDLWKKDSMNGFSWESISKDKVQGYFMPEDAGDNQQQKTKVVSAANEDYANAA